jgi:hypothetical protein
LKAVIRDKEKMLCREQKEAWGTAGTVTPADMGGTAAGIPEDTRAATPRTATAMTA